MFYLQSVALLWRATDFFVAYTYVFLLSTAFLDENFIFEKEKLSKINIREPTSLKMNLPTGYF
jgi:hypothetical protein